MPDRNVVLGDLLWALDISTAHRREMNVFYLHKNHLLWFHIRSFTITMVSRHQDHEIRNTALKAILRRTLTMKKSDISAINELLADRGCISYHEYPDISVLEKLRRNRTWLTVMALGGGMISVGVYFKDDMYYPLNPTVSPLHTQPPQKRVFPSTEVSRRIKLMGTRCHPPIWTMTDIECSWVKAGRNSTPTIMVNPYHPSSSRRRWATVVPLPSDTQRPVTRTQTTHTIAPLIRSCRNVRVTCRPPRYKLRLPLAFCSI